MENIKRLPKWARFRIEKLEADVEYYKKQVRQIEGKEESNIYISNLVDEKINLPKNAHLYFIVNGNPISVMMRRENLEIQGWRTINIHPKASNAIEVSQD